MSSVNRFCHCMGIACKDYAECMGRRENLPMHEPIKTFHPPILDMTTDREWLRQKAEAEDNSIISVGGLITELK